MLSFSILSLETGYNLLNFQSNQTRNYFCQITMLYSKQNVLHIAIFQLHGIIEIWVFKWSFLLENSLFTGPLNLRTPRLAENVINLFKSDK